MSEHPKNNNHSPLHPGTEVITRGFDPKLSVGSARPAVFRSSTYVFPSPEAAERAFDILGNRVARDPGEDVALMYSRFNHPNAEILENHMIPLERGAGGALVFNSGMAAIVTTMLAHLTPGDAVVYTIPIYGGTQHFIQDHLSKWGVGGIPICAGDTVGLSNAIRTGENVRIVLVETPANPTLTMTDLRSACEAAAARPGRRPLVMADNTLLGPAFQHPLALGVDVVLYSATKYLSGLSDMIGGVTLARDPEVLRPVRSLRNGFGNILQPDECWMLDGRLPTVGLRMNRQSKNASHIATALANHRNVESVIYPSLIQDPEQRRIFQSQCDFPGAMFSVAVKGGKAGAFEFLRNLRVAHNAVSLGGIETLVCHPKSTTHSGFTEEEFRQAGVTDGLVRVSVGIEDWHDLLQDFEQALDCVDRKLSAEPDAVLTRR